MAAVGKRKLVLRRKKPPVYVYRIGTQYLLLPPELKDIPGAQRVNPFPTKGALRKSMDRLVNAGKNHRRGQHINPCPKTVNPCSSKANPPRYKLDIYHVVKGSDKWPLVDRSYHSGSIIADSEDECIEEAELKYNQDEYHWASPYVFYTENPSPVERASKLSKKFHGAAPRTVKHIDFRSPKCLALIGSCAQLDYVSDKWDGKRRQYYHKFEKPCLVMADPDPQPDGSRMIVLLGTFKINERGIIG